MMPASRRISNETGLDVVELICAALSPLNAEVSVV
jgi:hypothetical protein